MRPVTVFVGGLGDADPTIIRTASGITGPVVFNGTAVSNGTSVYYGAANPILVPNGAALLDTPRRILFTNASNEPGRILDITGLDVNGNLQQETIVFGNAGTVASVLSYAVLLTATPNESFAGTVSIGTNTVADSQWVRLDEWAHGATGLQVDVFGTVDYTVYSTMDDPNSPTLPTDPANVTWIQSSDSNVVGASTPQQSNFQFAPIFCKVTLNSGDGEVIMTVTQYSVAPV